MSAYKHKNIQTYRHTPIQTRVVGLKRVEGRMYLYCFPGMFLQHRIQIFIVLLPSRGILDIPGVQPVLDFNQYPSQYWSSTSIRPNIGVQPVSVPILEFIQFLYQYWSSTSFRLNIGVQPVSVPILEFNQFPSQYWSSTSFRPNIGLHPVSVPILEFNQFPS